MKRSIGDVADFIRGITFKPEDKVMVGSPGSVVCMRTKNIQKDLDVSDLLAVPERFVRSQAKMLSEGDILVSSANSWDLVGKCCYVHSLGFDATAGGFISIVRAKTGTFPRFLYLWLNTPRMQHDARHCGRQTTNISNLDVDRYLALPFPDISYDEQRRIAAILDKADAIRRKRQQALALADAFLRSAFLEMFGDPATNPNGFDQVELQTLCLQIVDCLHKTPQHSEVVTPFPSLRTSDLQGGYIDLSTTKYVDEAGYLERIGRLKPLPGDIVYSREGERFGIAALIPLGMTPCLGQRTMMFRVDQTKATPEFFWAMLNSRGVYRQAERLLGGATSPHVNIGDIRKFKVFRPSLNLQQRFSGMVERHFARRAHLRTFALEADTLFASLSQRAFRGEL